VKTLRIDDVEGIPVFGTLVWKPIRKALGVTAFGINAYTAANAGDEVVEEHTEEPLGHEEIYAVIRGRATFTVDGEKVDAPAGTLVYLDDPKQQRQAIAQEPGTTVLAIGGVPGTHEVSTWEYFFPALPAIDAGDYGEARAILEDGLRERDHSALHYWLARVEALAGNEERAREELARCTPQHQEAFAKLGLLPAG
jgi:Tetratricopeptide repeat